MRALIVLLILALCVLHHDVWWWDSPGPRTPGGGAVGDDSGSEGVVLGFMPIGLAWHTLISIAASITWWLATVFCWPENLDDGSADGEGGSRISGGTP